jgi:hypothetical protein
LEQSYHQQPNSETGQSPLERYHQGSRFTRHVNLQEGLKYFLRKVRRKEAVHFLTDLLPAQSSAPPAAPAD